MVTRTGKSSKANSSTRRIINSFEELLRIMKEHNAGRYVYRGEDDVRYKLRPKIGRYEYENKTDLFEREAAILNEFKRRTAPYITHSPASDLDWLAVAQHHGLATRLLDWTENLFVAAYFATRDYQKTPDRTIYALDTDDLEYLDHDQDPFAVKNVAILEPKLVSPRIAAQMGVFTVHEEPRQEFRHLKLERWVIREAAVIDIGLSLDQLGFNSATMFPGLDGVAAHINEWHLKEE